MSKQDQLISTLRHQAVLITKLVEELEQNESAGSEDYAFAESQISRFIKNLKSARRSAISEMLGNMVRQNLTVLHDLAA